LDTPTTANIELNPADNKHLSNVCGPLDEHLKFIESELCVKISCRGNQFKISGSTDDINQTTELLNKLYQESQRKKNITKDYISDVIHHKHFNDTKQGNNDLEDLLSSDKKDKTISKQTHILTSKKLISPKSENQKRLIQNLFSYDINFIIGPAGTGKTFLAAAFAVQMLEHGDINRITLVRPAIEAGEKLGFLPGSLEEKINPYLRPLYDSLFDLTAPEQVNKYLEKGIIEIAPLAYMRGRTLNNSVIILDEAQNTSVAQMKMFLTRLGFNSKAIITGDISQIDLPNSTKSGLLHAHKILKPIKDLGFTYFDNHDVIRHPLLKEILKAYEDNEK